MTVAVFSGPENTSVMQGGRATLTCSNSAFTGSGAAVWSEEGGVIFAYNTGVFRGDDYAKYANFEIVSNSATQMDLLITNAVVADEGTYICEILAETGFTASFQVESKFSSSLYLHSMFLK